MSSQQTISIKLDESMRERIKRLAETKHRTAHWILREAVSQFVEQEEKREQLRQDALASWTECRDTGLHLTGEEVTGWLDTWGTENEQEAPQCHE